MAPEWTALLSALVASILTGAFSLAHSSLTFRRQARQQEARDISAASVAVLYASNSLVGLAQGLQTILRTRGTVGELLGLLLRVRLPLDEMALLRSYQDALTQVLNAQNSLACVGPRAAVAAGEAVCVAGAEYLQTCLRRTGVQRALHPLRAWRPTREQEQAAEAGLRSLMSAQADLLRVLRDKGGLEPIERSAESVRR